MDILQRSLQAAEILTGDDNDDVLSGLGLTFNGPAPSELPSDLQALVSQEDNLFNPASASANQDFENANSFDTSQFLNTPVNVASTSQTAFQTPISSGQVTLHAGNNKQGQVISPQSTPQYGNIPKIMNSAISNSPSSVFDTHLSSTVTTTVAQNVSVPVCASVFSKAPTQTLTSTVQMQPAMPPVNVQAYSVHGSISQPVQMSAPIQVLQTLPRHAIQQQGGTQLVTLVQKPAVMPINSGVSQGPAVVQNVNGLVMPSSQNNFAVLKIATTKPGLNLNGPQVLKAFTTNLVQKQSPVVQQLTDVQQQSQQQFIKLNQSNSIPLLNVTSQRPNQTASLQGAQHITLTNGQKILVNNGQQVRVCATQSSSFQQQGLSNVSAQSIVSNGAVQSLGSVNSRKVSQVPIKGIPIASVSIPIVSSAGGGTGSAQGSPILTIPVVSKQDGTPHTVNNVIISMGSKILSSTRMGTIPSSTTVRGLLANAIQKQNDFSPGVSSNMQALQLPRPGTPLQNGQIVLQGTGTTPIRLNLTSQQRNQLTPAQLQNILKQQARLKSTQATGNGAGLHQQNNSKTGVLRLAPQSSSIVAVPPTLTTSAVGNPAADRQPVQVFKVDATITQAQVDEVKKLLTSRTIASKLHCLTKEQQQLVLAFQAQIKTMSPPVQQYYLRNPQLFMHKVLQQTRDGKPFILHVKADNLLKAKPNATVSLPFKPQHPTISLTNESSHHSVVGNRIITPPLTGATHTLPPIDTKQQPQRKAFSVNVTSAVKTGVKRPAPPPDRPSKVTLVMEQLDCHKKMVVKPDCANPFGSVRDAIRRLVPYHTCNIPSIDQTAFDESEEMFDQISERIVIKARRMIDKYHLLRLRDSTRDSCSADMVMIERMFLQKEKAKYAQDKARLKEDPSLIREYFPQKESSDDPQTNGDETSSHNMEMEVNKIDNREPERPASDNHSTNDSIPSAANNAKNDSMVHIVGGDNYQNKDYERSLGTFSADGDGEESLLQEAVDSILI